MSRTGTESVLGESPRRVRGAGLPGGGASRGGLPARAARLRSTAAAVAVVREVDTMAGPAWISKVSARQAGV